MLKIIVLVLACYRFLHGYTWKLAITTLKIHLLAIITSKIELQPNASRWNTIKTASETDPSKKTKGMKDVVIMFWCTCFLNSIWGIFVRLHLLQGPVTWPFFQGSYAAKLLIFSHEIHLKVRFNNILRQTHAVFIWSICLRISPYVCEFCNLF